MTSRTVLDLRTLHAAIDGYPHLAVYGHASYGLVGTAINTL